ATRERSEVPLPRSDAFGISAPVSRLFRLSGQFPMFTTAAHQVLPSRYLVILLPISQSLHAHRTEPLELLNFNVIESRGLLCEYSRCRHLPLTLLSCERLFIGVVLLLSLNEDLVLLRCRKHVIQLPVVLNGRASALGELTDRLLLLGRGDRNELKT